MLIKFNSRISAVISSRIIPLKTKYMKTQNPSSFWWQTFSLLQGNISVIYSNCSDRLFAPFYKETTDAVHVFTFTVRQPTYKRPVKRTSVILKDPQVHHISQYFVTVLPMKAFEPPALDFTPLLAWSFAQVWSCKNLHPDLICFILFLYTCKNQFGSACDKYIHMFPHEMAYIIQLCIICITLFINKSTSTISANWWKVASHQFYYCYYKFF